MRRVITDDYVPPNSVYWDLRKYCHGKKCQRPTECPEKHKCRTDFDLDTAIAWEAAITVMSLYYESNHGGASRGERMIIHTLYKIVGYHADKYQELARLLKNLYFEEMSRIPVKQEK